MTLEELTAWMKDQGESAFRGKQIFKWLYRGVTSFEEMTDLSKQLRQKLEETCVLVPPRVARKQVSAQDGTIKYLWELADALPARQYGVYLQPGGLPHGLCLLRLHHRRQGAGPDGGGNDRPGAFHPNGQRSARFQHCFNGNWRAAGQF